MDATEKHVYNHLTHRGFTDIVYEPDGNIPPDFLVDGTIAVEVRRLNQNHFSGNEVKGLEEVAIPLWSKITQLLENFGPPVQGTSWFVHFRFSRPVEPWKNLEPQLRSALETFSTSSMQTRKVLAKGRGFELEVYCRASKPLASMFVLAGCSDMESGGWVLSEMETNVRHCVTEKTRKIQKYHAKYPEWWLALVDHIGYGLSNFDRDMFRAQASIQHSWDKIVIISPQDHTNWFEI